jgi:replicative DNA helicase
VATVSRQRRGDEDADVIAFADRDREPPKKRGARRIKLVEAFAGLRRITKRPIFPTPFGTLNTALGLGGHIAGQVIVLAGGTGMGKTTLLLEFAQHYAVHDGPVIFVSLEMEAGHCIARAAAPHMGCTANELLRGDILVESHQVPLSDRIEFVESASLGELGATIEEVKAEYGTTPLVVLDYLQKLVARTMAGDARPDPRLATTNVSASLIAMARELEVPMLVATATGRGSAAKLRGRPGRRGGDPRDLPPGELVDVAKESGDVEYDAAALLALHVSDETDVDGYSIATLTVAKSRFGRAQHIAMAYDGGRAIWIDRGRVERKKKDDEPNVDVSQLTAERVAALNKIAADAFTVLAVEPLSMKKLAERLHRKRADVELALQQPLRSGTVIRVGTGPKQALAMAAVTPELPGMGG